MDLKDIKSPADIKGLSVEQLKPIAEQMRKAILHRTSMIGGHVGPNLGVVEATIAMHYVFDAPTDKLVYDVSHQDFPHKMLTGRVNGFINDADFDKVGEYTSPVESPEYDVFYAGHTSPMTSLAVGLAKARELNKQDYHIVVMVGDGALSGGEAFEGLNAAANVKGNFVILVNDNQMAIAPDYGGMYRHLHHLRETNGTAPDNLFRAFGLDYMYVAEGNDLATMIAAMQKAKSVDHPIVVHVNTQKGQGYVPAEEWRERFHWRPPYDIASGAAKELPATPNEVTVLQEWLMSNAKATPNMVIITSATPGDFGLGPKQRAELGAQFIDVDIAEQTGVSVMAGAARGGAKAVYPVVGTFLQRAYDQLMEDWAMDASPALLVVCATGINAIRDQTHLGWWDIPMITSIPDIVYLAPTNLDEFRAMLDWGFAQDNLKVAVRQPYYSVERADGPVDTDYSYINTFKIIKPGKQVAIIAAGDFMVKGKAVVKLLAERGVDATLINPRFVSGVDTAMLKGLETDHQLVATLEDGSVEGGFGQRVASALGTSPLKVLNFGVAKKFVDRYQLDELERANGLQPQQIADTIMQNLN